MKMTKKRFLLGIAVLICAATILLRGCHLTSKHDVEKTAISDASVWLNPFSKSSLAYRDGEEFHQWLLDNRKLADEIGAVGPIDKLLLSAHLENKGMARLPTGLLEQRLSSVNKILASMDTPMCSKYIKGKMPESEFQHYAFPVIESFSDVERKAWFFVNKSAIEAQLDRSPIIVLSTENAKQTILKIAGSMDEPQSRAFLSGLARLQTESDEEACEMARNLYVRGNSLPEPYRGYVARMLLAGEDGHEKL
jgi:hypothetical protein